jgi:hypothetical protein
MAQIAGRMPQLHGKGRVAQQLHQLGWVFHTVGNRNRHRSGEHAGNLAIAERAAKTLRNHRSQSVVHRLGHRSCELRPLVDGALHPAGAGQHIRIAGCGIELAGGIQPQVRLTHRAASRLAIHGGHAGCRTGGVGLLQGNRLGELDVDRPFLDSALHITHRVESAGAERGHHLLDFRWIGQSAGVLTHQLFTDLLRQLADLLPGHLTLNGAEAFDQPLVNRVVVHAYPSLPRCVTPSVGSARACSLVAEHYFRFMFVFGRFRPSAYTVGYVCTPQESGTRPRPGAGEPDCGFGSGR